MGFDYQLKDNLLLISQLIIYICDYFKKIIDTN